MDEGHQDDLARLLREGDEAALGELLTTRIEEISPADARQVFRNPYLTAVLIARLLGSKRLLASYEVRMEAARHPRTPQIVALRFIPPEVVVESRRKADDLLTGQPSITR